MSCLSTDQHGSCLHSRTLVHRSWQRGVTLIELMISMVIGMAIIAAAVALYGGTSAASNISQQQAQLSDDGQFALKLIANQIRQAGYNPVQKDRTTLNPLLGNFAIFACQNGFQTATVATPDLLTCNGSAAAGGHALAITYEADTRNTIPTALGVPTSCLGESLVQRSVIETLINYNYYMADNRFYVSNNQLFCAGIVASPTAQVMVPNVERLEFSFGVTSPTTTSGTTVTGYLSANALGHASGSGGSVDGNLTAVSNVDRWKKVATVRVCVIMRSETPILGTDLTHYYYGCDAAAAPISITDGILRRAFITTVALRNRISTP